MRADCERRWEIDALREGRLGAKDAEAFQRHARGCAVCSATMARDARLRELARSLPAVEPNEMDLRRLRARVLHDVATGTPGRPVAWAPLASALALALIAVVSWAAIGPRAAPARAPVATGTSAKASPAGMASELVGDGFAGTILRDDGAFWSRTREEGVERIRLERGTLKIHVRHQTPSERFLVELPDGELEVRGTTFEVTAHATATDRVHVEEGLVVVRIAGHAEVEVAAGEEWPPTKPAPARAASAAPHAVAPKPAGPPATVSSVAAPDDGTEAYAAAVALLQGGRYPDAASAFRDFLVAHPRTPQAEDASFLEAAALARAGRSDAAAAVAEDHLARFPGSFHRREAAILVARAARDRGDCARATAVLAPWLGDPPDVEARSTVEKCGPR